ncbi:MAG TPA: hypothetical protein VMT67_13160 [Terriglobales bacterium]|nr:hypothetical protein [Terriglobales bacterium]
MNACVESVCPNPMMPEALDARVREGRLPIPTRESARAWLGKVWTVVAGPREPKAPTVVHVHVESFYAAVEQAENPRLRGRGLLVEGGGVVASASTETAGRGVVTGMTIREARKACPNAVVVRGDIALYAEYATRVRQILETYCRDVEMTASGSYYLEFSGAALPFRAFEAKLRRIQTEILGQTGLSVSVGAGMSRLVAALAAREHRPCGLRIVARGEERAFLAPLPIERLRGIGRKQVAALKQGGLATIGELQRIPKPVFVATFGAAIGMRLWNLARGREASDWVQSGPIAAAAISAAIS